MRIVHVFICILSRLLPRWLAGGAEDPRDYAPLGRHTGWRGKALAGLGKYSWTQPSWGGKEVIQGDFIYVSGAGFCYPHI